MQRAANNKTGLFICVMAGFAFAGCDKKQQDVPKMETPPPATAAVALHPTTRPSTQSLLAGPRKSLVLGNLPLRMIVPDSWKIVATTGASWLEGPTPGGSVRIQLVGNPIAFNAETLALRDKKAEKDAAASSGMLEVVPLKPLGVAAQVMQRRETFEGKVRGFDGEPQPAQMMDWTVEVYVPQDKDFALDLLHFAPLSIGQYKTDRDFLQQILSTLHYDAAKGLFSD